MDFPEGEGGTADAEDFEAPGLTFELTISPGPLPLVGEVELLLMAGGGGKFELPDDAG